MNITELATSRETEAASAVGEWLVHSPMGHSSLSRFYRRDLYLRFETGGNADRILIDSSATTLKATFHAYKYDALDSIELPLLELLEPPVAIGNNLVKVTLDAPRQVHKVKLTKIETLSPDSKLEFYRLDGETPAEQPTIQVAVVGDVATLPEAANLAFIDVRFAIGLKDSTLAPKQISELWLTSYPTTPRIGVAGPTGDAPIAFFSRMPGELGKPPSSDQAVVEVGSKLAEELQRYVDELSTPLPLQVEVRLVVESDAPCKFKLADSDFNVSYCLARESWSSGRNKEVLRFPGTKSTTQEVSMMLPGSARVRSATLEVAESFRRDRAQSEAGLAVATETLTQKRSAYVGDEKWVGQEFTPPQSTSVSGLSLGIMALANETQLSMELQENWQGRPSGKKLAEGTLSIAQAGRSVWATGMLSEPVTLSSKPYWLLVKATRGHALWLAESDTTSMHVLERSTEEAVWKEASAVPGLRALFQLLSRSGGAEEQPPIVVSAAGTPVEPVNSRNGTGNRSGVRIFDLADAINIYLASGSYTGIVAIPVALQARVLGIATVYPPRVLYDL